MIQLKGAARDHMMFVEGGDPLDVPIESLIITSPISEEAAKRGNQLPFSFTIPQLDNSLH